MKKTVICFFNIIYQCLKLSFKASKFYSITRFIVRIVNSLSVIVLTFLTSMLINSIVTGSANRESYKVIVMLSILILLFGVMVSVVSKVNDYCTAMHNEILSNFLNVHTMEKTLTADLEYYDSPAFYDAIEAVKGDSYSVINIVWNVIDGISSLITAIFAFTVVCKLNIFYGILIIITVIPSTIANQKFTKLIYNWGLEHIKEQRQLSYLQFISSNKAYAMDIRLFNLKPYIRKKYTDLWNSYFFIKKKKMKRRTFYVVIFGFLPDVCIGLIELYIAVNIFSGRGTIGDYTLYSGILGQLSANLYYLVTIVMRIYEDRMRIKNVKKIMSIKNNVVCDGKKRLGDKICIEFRNVSFCYPNTDKMILRNISFKINNNEKVCLIGLNGSGKSTIMKLLLRFYDVTTGEILINDIHIQEYDLLELRKCFSSFFQGIVNYCLTLRENIVLSDLDKAATGDKEVIEALMQSDAIDLLEKCPKGLDQYITKNFDKDGIELSGGQYQKLALARALYRNCSIILFDEPSAALDPQAENNLFQNLKLICKNKTMIFTSHRLSNVYLADRIIFIEDGMIVEEGRHKELINSGGKYAALYKCQAGKFGKNAVDEK